MNQTEQVTSITGSAIDAAIQDERMAELERQINTLYAEAARQAEYIERLEQQITKEAEDTGGLIANLRAVTVAQGERLQQLETCATLNAETIGQVELLKVALVEQGMRIEKLEAAASLVHPYTLPEFTASHS